MDPKASARSKRTHSQHGRRNHPPSAAAAAAAAAARKKQPQPQHTDAEETARRSHRNALPSNWDRYLDDDEEHGTADEQANAKKADAEVAPKSKGADFSYLIEQARSQPQEFRRAAPLGSSSSDDFSLGLMQGFSSMLSVRGESLLSWCGDDNFIVDDDHTSSYEIPFLSMDLNGLAEQLSKLKLSQRLFIEPDLLPEEQWDDKSQERNLKGGQLDTSGRNELRHSSDPLAFVGQLEPEGNLGVKGDDSMLDTGIKTTRASELNKSGFEAATAEAELDMLLDSFAESSLPSSLTDSPFNNPSNQRTASALPSAPISLLSPTQDGGLSRSAASTSLNDTIDDLLAESSLSLKDQTHENFLPKREALPSESLPHLPKNPSSSLGLLPSTNNLDDSLDDLLAESSLRFEEQKQRAHTEKEGAPVSEVVPAARPAALASKPMDDFDSWLDTL